MKLKPATDEPPENPGSGKALEGTHNLGTAFSLKPKLKRNHYFPLVGQTSQEWEKAMWRADPLPPPTSVPPHPSTQFPASRFKVAPKQTCRAAAPAKLKVRVARQLTPAAGSGFQARAGGAIRTTRAEG